MLIAATSEQLSRNLGIRTVQRRNAAVVRG